ncbi:metallophosphoesterase [Pseudanabaenaceae cyanobacterium LEGE 13415]|nr:metallophosphoesterase [Pseudanabaenaceae cyanobacterium LEGE 13415]
MAVPIRYLHLSDFHVGKDKYAERKMFRKILNHVQEKKDQNWIPDLVFITGDIANRGKAEEYEVFTDEFLLGLYETLGNWNGLIFTVPGNHDVNRNEVEFLAREELCRSRNQVFESTRSGLQKRQRALLPGINAYCNNDESNAPKQWINSEAGTFHQIVTIREQQVGIVGMNTAWLSKDDDDERNLTPGVELVKEALEQIEACQVRIVLGHHPLDWLLKDDGDRIRQAFGRCGVLYLHGHLHEACARGEENSAGKGFLNIQAGAAFQARDGDERDWKNGLLWGELDLEQYQLRLQPRHWSAKHEAWVMSSESFHPDRELGNGWWKFPLPGAQSSPKQSKSAKVAPAFPKVKPPEGWNIENDASLATRRASLEKTELSEEEALQYFDGGTPGWRLALSQTIDRREIVADLHNTLITGQGQDKPSVILLLGAGGEGKSTAVYQTIVDLITADSTWQVLWRHDPEVGLSLKNITSLPEDGRKWLVASDDADSIAADVFKIVKELYRKERDDIQFLLTCRDTDWIASEQESYPVRDWLSVSNFHRKDISGLSDRDATIVVQAWQRFGDRGLGELAGKPETEAVKLLVHSARTEATIGEGAFFGAMLKMRLGDQLKEHLRVMLHRFASREIPGGDTLLRAFAYIAAMHSEGLMILSKPVLSEALNCDPKALKMKVLFPLGKEAAATQAGRFIFTRHRRIAQASIEILQEQFGEDLDELYMELGKAAMTAGARDIHIPEYSTWKHKLPQHFIQKGNVDLGIAIAEEMLAGTPHDAHLLVTLGKLYKQHDRAEQASQLFRSKVGQVLNNEDNRVLYAAWGTVEADLEHRALAVWINAISLADQTAQGCIDNQQASIGFTIFGLNVIKLYEKFNDRIFAEGQSAVAHLGLLIATPTSDPTGYQYFQNFLKNGRGLNIPEMTVRTAFQTFLDALEAAYQVCGEKHLFVDRLLPPSDLTFDGLHYLINRAIDRNQKQNENPKPTKREKR